MYKTKLQELCQKNYWAMPKYTSYKVGPDHKPRFTASVAVNGLSFESTQLAKSSKEAQGEAARLAFVHLTSPEILQSPPNGSLGGDCGLNAISVYNETEESRNKNISNNVQLHENDSSANEDIEIGEALHLWKSQLQTLAQKRNMNLPVYTCDRDGPPHALRFKATVTIDGKSFESPDFYKTLKEAEQVAARAAFVSLSGGEHDDGHRLYKNLLQEFVSREGLSSPIYKTISSGASHMQTFFSTVVVGGEIFSGKAARSKKAAEMNAAKVALSKLNERRYNWKPESFDEHLSFLQSYVTFELPPNVSGANVSTSVPTSDQAPVKSEDKCEKAGEAEENASCQVSNNNKHGIKHVSSPSVSLPNNKSDMMYARLRDPFALGPFMNEDEKPSSLSIPSCSRDDLVSHNNPRKQSASMTKIQVYPRMVKMTLPKGAVILPFSDDNWVAVKIEGPLG